MTAHDEGRRGFLIKSAASVAAVAGTALPQAVDAQTAPETLPEARLASASSTSVTSLDNGEQGRTFFNEDESYAVTAIAERIMPGAPGKPGASEANVVNYIDLALSGAYADQQEFYRRGLHALDQHCRTQFNDTFANLKAPQQDEALVALESGKATGFDWPTPQAFFATLRTHTMEGMFSDPVYGGNRDFAGWRLVGFPGAQRIYTSGDLKNTGEFAGPIVGMKATGSMTKGRI